MRRRAVLSCIGAIIAAAMTPLTVDAEARGNTTVYQAIHSEDTYSSCTTGPACNVASGWWGGVSLPVTQRYGCTAANIEPDQSPSFCNQSHDLWWHQGIDIGTNQTSIAISSQVEGAVADYSPKPASSCSLTSTTLGWLAIRTNGGNVVFLLHGCTRSAFANVGTPVHINNYIYDTGANGGFSTGWHLHFEVHNSLATGTSLSSSTGPGDDINPEGWLFRLPTPSGQQLTTWSAGDLGEFARGSANDMYQSDGGPTGAWASSWTHWSQPSGSGFYEGLRSNPVAVSQGPNEFDAFAILQGGDLGWWSYVSGFGVCGWVLIAHPASALSQGLTAVSPYVGDLEVFAQGVDGKIYHWSANDSGNPGCSTYLYGWQAFGLPSGFPPSPTTFGSDMVAVSSDHDNIFLVARDSSGNVQSTHFDNRVWYAWQNLSGPQGSSGSGIAAVAWRTSDPTTGTLTRELDVFARSVDPTSDLFHAQYKCNSQSDDCGPSGWGTGWMGDISTQGAFHPSGDFVAVSWVAFRIDIFVRDQNYDSADGWLWHDAYTATQLTGIAGWTGYPGQNFRAPAVAPGCQAGCMVVSHLGVVALGYQSIDVVVQATPDRTSYQYWHLCYCNNNWNALPSGP